MGQMPRRLEVEHLRQSIPRLFGGIQWQDRNENSMWDVLSRTLGEADYVEVTENNVEATPLFAKFMDDMAAQVCSKALDRDAQTAEAEQRLVLRHADVKANLRFLRLKLHGVMVDADNDAASKITTSSIKRSALRRRWDKPGLGCVWRCSPPPNS